MEVDYKETIGTEEIKELPNFTFEGEVIVVEDAAKIDEAVRFLSAHSHLGFDTETKPAFKKGEYHAVSLLQLAVDGKVYLFRLNKCGFPVSLRRLMADENIMKIGVGIRDDVKCLRRLGEFKPASFLDLQIYVEAFGINEKSFSKLMAIIFGVRISKRQRTSNWEAAILTQPQVRYAATDAWGALRMYKELSRKR